MVTGKDIKSVDDILAIKDLRTAVNIAKEWNVDMKEVKSLDDAKKRLIKFYQDKGKDDGDGGGGRGGEQNLASAFQEHQQARQTLLQKYQASYKFLRELQPGIQGRLEQSFPNLDNLFKDRRDSLQSGECTILVAGEVGAGKSSLINLLLGVQLFPTDALRCTNTICEIRCSEEKKALAYYKAELSDSGERQRRVGPKTIHLGSLKGIQEFKDCVVECNEDDSNPYERIEVYWPFENICKGLVIVDTPGIEGGSNVDQSLDKYLSKAFGFIYVINTTTAGGVQQGRLGSLLRHVVISSEDFDPDASIFIGNKWEQVPDQDKDDVMKDTFMKLSNVYPGIRPKQVHYMSIKTAHQVSMEHKTQTKEHKALLQSVMTLIPNSLRYGMASHYWWLSNFLKRANYVIHVTSVQSEMTREQLETQRKGLTEQVAKLQRNTDENIQMLREKVGYETYRITNTVKSILTSKEILAILCDWSVGADCPSISSRWKRTADEAAVKIADKITRTIDGWEKQNRILKTIDNKIVDVFSREFGLMEDQIKELEDALLHNRGTQLNSTMKVVPIKKWWPGNKKKKIERTYTTLGGAVTCIGMLDTSRKEVKNIFKDINERNKSSKMAEATMLYLETILTHKDMVEKLKKYFSKFLKDIDEAAKRIPQFLQADQKLIETISQKLVDITSSQLTHLREKCHDLSARLDIFFVNELMKFDYELSEIDWKRDSLLGTGSFADVYKAVLKRKNKPVALKVCRDPVTRQNVSDILTEDRIMRDLKHPNVVKHFGATYRRMDKTIYWIIIMDLCDTTLKHIYTADTRVDRDIPGLCGSGHPNWTTAVRNMANNALQIFQGLQYIHEKGYTHRDMKLENVLKVKNEIKITDVGVAKQTSMLFRTCNGSPAYMAPEVLLANQGHTNKIDIYSTALMCWEMWFGRDVADDMNRDILGFGFQGNAMEQLRKRQSDPEKCFRPSLSLANKPPDNVIDILKRGWAFDPEKRPTAAEMVQFFKAFLKNN